MDQDTFIEVAKSLVCVMDREEVIAILEGENWDEEDITAFIMEAEVG